MRIVRVLALSLLSVAAGACASGGEVSDNVSDQATVAATETVTPDQDISAETLYSAELTGTAEVPGPGDEDGRGEVSVDVSGPPQICYQMTVEGIETATAAHIHQGAEGKSGDPVVELQAPAEGDVDECVEADESLIADIVEHPDEFYVNVHNDEFPDGAIRGQLGPPEP